MYFIILVPFLLRSLLSHSNVILLFEYEFVDYLDPQSSQSGLLKSGRNHCPPNSRPPFIEHNRGPWKNSPFDDLRV